MGLEDAILPASFASSILLVLLVERILHAILSTAWHLSIGFDKDETKYSFAAMQLLTSTASATSRVGIGVLSAFASVLSGMLTWLFFISCIVLITGLLYMGYEQYPVVARGFILQWNSYIGPQVRSLD